MAYLTLVDIVYQSLFDARKRDCQVVRELS